MEKSEFIAACEDSVKAGTLITEKHDPYELANTRDRKRTVVSLDVADNTLGFFKSEEFEATEFENTDPNHGSLYISIKPTNTTYSIPASGVPKFSDTPTTQCDRLVAVSGSKQGLHIFGETDAKIQQMIVNGQLIYKGPIN